MTAYIKIVRLEAPENNWTDTEKHLILSTDCFGKAQEMSGKKWALLVAGSKGWENYRHQANVCCLYQIIKKHGIPDEQIVVMMYDDIATNPQNPTNGVIVSVVGDTDVYSGVPKDYTGEDVTPDNFLAALQGDDSTGKKVIKSEANDNIYVFMSGLGTEGTFKFPEQLLCPADLIGAINNMHNENKFSKMVIFMSSSYSATMFQQLSGHVNVFALTSCGLTDENCPTDLDPNRNVFLSDKFSSAWLNFTYTADFNKEPFHSLINHKQANYLEQNPNLCPCQFGNEEICHCHLSEFLQN
ncbi:legumain-like [Onychostoma macrolepis]|uniref:legumain-like n=1 Tax=Onychostoma macrolepis TaxID=369639 RepID=UPI002729D5F2|nr:legumain-like [Onychostoma macrolepis]